MTTFRSLVCALSVASLAACATDLSSPATAPSTSAEPGGSGTTAGATAALIARAVLPAATFADGPTDRPAAPRAVPAARSELDVLRDDRVISTPRSAYSDAGAKVLNGPMLVPGASLSSPATAPSTWSRRCATWRHSPAARRRRSQKSPRRRTGHSSAEHRGGDGAGDRPGCAADRRSGAGRAALRRCLHEGRILVDQSPTDRRLRARRRR